MPQDKLVAPVAIYNAHTGYPHHPPGTLTGQRGYIGPADNPPDFLPDPSLYRLCNWDYWVLHGDTADPESTDYTTAWTAAGGTIWHTTDQPPTRPNTRHQLYLITQDGDLYTGPATLELWRHTNTATMYPNGPIYTSFKTTNPWHYYPGTTLPNLTAPRGL